MEKLVCGIDEAGRGPLAGPVTAAAVILCGDFPREILADSKKLTCKKRLSAEYVIKQKAAAWSTGWAWPEEIDRLNIHCATLLAMRRALDELFCRPDCIFVDGKFAPPIDIECTTIVKGDTIVPEIMAASIIAKTARDRWMERYSRIEPLWRFEVHKGYPTALHRELIRQFGISAIHRKSFRLI